jgi:2-phosphosulfolactate phosphatase
MRVAVALVPALEPDPGHAFRDALHDRPRALPRPAVVVIDVLRATSTLTVALANGARRVVPFARAEEAVAFRAREDGVLACGEREGRIVPGFDLGNSPFEYTPERVAGRTLAFASTNGSLAVRAVAGFRRRLLAAFVNASAVARSLAEEREVLMLCAGQLGRFALEDAACAGWLCARLAERGATLANDGARLAWALAPRDAADVRALVEGSSHGRYLRSLGPAFARDVAFCAVLDRFDRAFEV